MNLGLIASLCLAQPIDPMVAPELPAIPDGLPNAVPLDGGTLLPTPLDMFVANRLLQCETLQPRCQARIDSVALLGRASVISATETCLADCAAQVVEDEARPKPWSWWQYALVGLGVFAVGAGTGLVVGIVAR